MGGVLSALRGLRAASPEPASPHHSVVQGDQSEPAEPESAHICQHSLPRTDLHRYLSNNDTDHPSGLPIGLCSLALRYFLPECELERYLYRLTTEAEESTSLVDDCSSQVRKLLTGSSSEGLGVPMFCSRTFAGGGETMCDAPLTIPTPDTPPGEQGDGPVVTTSDKDCMFELGHFPVAPERGEARLFMDARSASHRGYVHVLMDPDWSPSPGVETSRMPSDQLLRPLPVEDGAAPEQRLCLSSDALMKVWHDNNQFSGTVERHGPAINSIQLLHGMPVDFDSVPALRLTRPPQQLLDWLKRIDECGARWPPEEVRESIRSGTEATAHLVATGHASSARRDLEWRLSFSVAEKRLARTLSITQRKAYLLVKLVQKCFLARPKVLVTYHLKTLMFWELETTQHCWSEEHLFGRVLGLLDRIDACLSEHRIPSYFFPENNLISDCSAEDVAAVRRALGLVRGDLLRSLFAIDAAVRFEFSTATPLMTFHEPFLNAIAAGVTIPSIAKVAATAASGLIRQARDGLPRNKHTLARSSELLRDALQLLSAAGAAAPREGDWLMMTAAALCAANHRDEDVWVRDVLRKRVVSAEDVPPLTERHVQLWEAAIRSLLLLSPCEISLPALDVLFMYAAPLLEAAAEEHETPDSPSPEESVTDVLVTWEEVVCELGLQPLSDAARLSDAVLKLCLVRLAGGTERQCAECLTEAEDQIGGEATVSVRRALAEVSSING
ncbi:Protein MB21D2 [Amphibalanus amphitrite]|uniref:Protein MB21D2 n=1 Tax=Amphibalanus amphitrite TaxID=1232801 RepID=A0A6A4W9U4_AMPAM|nr:Protein MB21D2 [Amphibalanus amphitrite]